MAALVRPKFPVGNWLNLHLVLGLFCGKDLTFFAVFDDASDLHPARRFQAGLFCCRHMTAAQRMLSGTESC
jgi:hypothetical protein